MREDKKVVKQARQNFRSNLKSARMYYRKEVRTLRQTVPKKGRFRKPTRNSLFQEKNTELKENLLSSQKEAEEKFLKEITYVSPRLLKVKEIKKYRLPQAQERLRTARKHLSEVKLSEKSKSVNPKFTFQKENPSLKSRFQFHQEKSFDRLSAEKEVSSAKREVKQLKKVQKSKKSSTKVKAGLGLVASESLDLVAQDDDLDGLRTLKDTSLKARRYGRFTYQAGKVAVKSGQTGVRFTKTKVAHGKERFQNFKKGKGFTRQKPLKPQRRYRTFLKHAKKHSLAGVKGIAQAIKGSLTFFSAIAGNPLTWIVSGILLILLLMLSFFMSVSGSSVIQQDEMELTKAYTHMTWEDAEHTRTNEKGITYYTKIDEIMVYMNHQYQDYKLDDVMETGGATYKAFLSQLWTDLNGGDSIKSMSDLYKEPSYKLAEEDQEELRELTEEGNYLVLQELDNPFQGQNDEDSLNMTYRYGYEVIDEKPTLHHHIILEAKEGQVIVAPMDGKVSLDGENIIMKRQHFSVQIL
ncbi:Tn5252 Orf28 [Streptococcus canis]|nr:Tn5252 Orf28 [Streptococcus canis]